MTTPPRVSIVTISLNQGRFLERALRSVATQDYPEIEHVVVDAGSTDGSREILDAWRPRLAAVILEPDQGPPDGLNKGFAASTGSILAYVNADDALLPGAVREAVEYLEANRDVAVVYGDGYLVDTDGKVTRRIESSPFNLRRYSYGQVSVLQQATFIRRSAFERVGGFNIANPTSWDGELLLEIAVRGGTLRHIRRDWGVFAIHPESITGSDRLAVERLQTRRRLFRIAHRRAWRRTDALLRHCFRVEKWLVAPGTTARRFASKLLPGRESRFLLNRPGVPVQIVRGNSAGDPGMSVLAGEASR